MSQRINVLFLANPKETLDCWGKDVVEVLSDRHELKVFDVSKPLAPQFENVDAVIDYGGEGGTREMADIAAGKVKLWQLLGQGFDTFDVEYWKSKGIPVSNCPGSNSSAALAECAMMFILMLARKFQVCRAHLAAGGIYEPMANGLEGLKLGIIGFGAAGTALARRALPFGMEISAVDIRKIGADKVREFGLSSAGGADDTDALIAASDFVSIHLHLNAETRHIIDDRRIRLMKPTACLVNVARGQLVDEAALSAALMEGRIAGAGIDVYGQEPPDLSAPIFSMPNVVLSPHIAGTTDITARKRAENCAANCDRIAADLEPLHRVDQ